MKNKNENKCFNEYEEGTCLKKWFEVNLLLDIIEAYDFEELNQMLINAGSSGFYHWDGCSDWVNTLDLENHRCFVTCEWSEYEIRFSKTKPYKIVGVKNLSENYEVL